MGFLDKLLKKHSVYWCKECKCDTEIVQKQLYFMPKRLGDAMPSQEFAAHYFIQNLQPVDSKSQIPASYYACGIRRHRCPHCRKTRDTAEVFLPVRDQEQYERTYHFENGELNNLNNFNY